MKNNADEDGQKWGIYSFAIGDRAPISELDKLSHQNMGSSTQVKDNEGRFSELHFRSKLPLPVYFREEDWKTLEDVSGILTDFFRDFSSPILWNYDITYQGVTEYDCSDSNLFFDQELVCIGKISHKPCDKPKIEEPTEEKVGFLMANPDMLKPNSCNVKDDAYCTLSSNPTSTKEYYNDADSTLTNPFAQSLWVDLAKVMAYQQIRRKQELFKVSRNETLKEILKSEVIELGLENNFVTKFTNLAIAQSQNSQRSGNQFKIKLVKKRSHEKEMELRRLMKEYEAEVNRLRKLEKKTSVGGFKTSSGPSSGPNHARQSDKIVFDEDHEEFLRRRRSPQEAGFEAGRRSLRVTKNSKFLLLIPLIMVIKYFF